jgi:hypothetical protein
VWLGWKYEQKRREALRTWATSNGWTWRPEKRRSPGLPFDLFTKGHSRYSRYHASREIDDAIPGLDGCSIELFEYHYAITSHSGKRRSTTHYYHYCVVARTPMDLGEVLLRDEHFGDKFVQAIGFDDIDLEDPEFSRRFVLKAKDRREAYDLIDSGMMRYLVRHSGWTLETTGGLVFVYSGGKAQPERYGRAASYVLGFLAQTPRILVNRARAERGLPPLLDAGGASAGSRAAREA